jgi:hypothetical protein
VLEKGEQGGALARLADDLPLFSAAAAQSKGLAAEQAPIPWWAGICSEKPRFGADLMAAIACKLLMLRDSRAPIPYAAEQRNKSGEQGEKSG